MICATLVNTDTVYTHAHTQAGSLLLAQPAELKNIEHPDDPTICRIFSIVTDARRALDAVSLNKRKQINKAQNTCGWALHDDLTNE